MHPAVWDLIERTKPADRLVLISDALSMSGTGPGRTIVSGVDIEIHEDRATLAGSETLAGSVMALDSMLRNIVRNGMSLPSASAMASGNPLGLLGITDRGRLEPGLLADLVVMDAAFDVHRVMRGGVWHQDVGHP